MLLLLYEHHRIAVIAVNEVHQGGYVGGIGLLFAASGEVLPTFYVVQDVCRVGFGLQVGLCVECGRCHCDNCNQYVKSLFHRFVCMFY